MATGRLTRQELGWLLAQEARGAAKSLRQDVALLSQPPPPPGQQTQGPVQVETTLNALDDAIGLLSELEAGPVSGKGRRGRIDLAALLYELAPNARIAIEPGAGTEVYGEEADLRRLLHVLVSQANSLATGDATAAEIRIRRQDDWIRMTVDLGPDISASSEIERRWLGRMATRLGGRVELEGGAESILLPADASVDQSEVADLKKELQQAQQLGEAYARELASVFATEPPAAATATSADAEAIAIRRLALMVSMASALSRAMKPLLQGLKEDVASASSKLGHEEALSQSLLSRVSAGYEIVGELGRLASCPLDEAEDAVDTAKAARNAVDSAEGRAARHSVSLQANADDAPTFQTRPSVFRLLLRTLIDHAIAASPQSGMVELTLTGDASSLTVAVSDGGPVVPAASSKDLLEHRVDPAGLGRPTGISLPAANTLAGYLGGTVQLTESKSGEHQVVVRFGSPKSA